MYSLSEAVVRYSANEQVAMRRGKKVADIIGRRGGAPAGGGGDSEEARS